ncbi:MAG: cytidylate kinase-like family protein [Ignavibacteria bacterium]|nr:cytidylate kinase-like family protein [Ignavibacteria bacterium]MBT8381246.1 cytidylate kinase-like family protein [Ignavibacteria bacterium]MBT8391268.1 cytidylate kinase-like family protein [Ignavibacteria bacterium]NNJ54377.1 cytidylate kinase-like family protein [Ignavibacteriaceae bacterium]NNL21689.1 cytidylate kinase-like family protein [Ignavibacteriaceae bacterium]
MGIITISRGSFSRGVEIAEKLAKKLGYECISREILLEASKEFNVPEAKLQQAIQDAPSIFDHIKDGKKKYVAFIRQAFLEHIQNDDLVYHGYAGHFFAKEIPNILKVRILANLDYRVKVVMEREKISEDEARKLLYKIDIERRKWSMYLYGIDTNVTELYDLVLHIDCIDVQGAVEIIYDIAKRPCFKATPSTIKKIENLLANADEYSNSII